MPRDLKGGTWRGNKEAGSAATVAGHSAGAGGGGGDRMGVNSRGLSLPAGASRDPPSFGGAERAQAPGLNSTTATS